MTAWIAPGARSSTTSSKDTHPRYSLLEARACNQAGLSCLPGPASLIERSPDPLILPLQERRRDRQPEGLGGLEVDDQLELGRLFDGQIAGLGAFQDLVHVEGSSPKQVREDGAIGRETPRIDVPANVIHHGELVFCCQLSNLPPFTVEERTEGNDQGSYPLLQDERERPTQPFAVADRDDFEREPERSGRRLRRLHTRGRTGKAAGHQDGDPSRTGDHFLEELQALAVELGR